MTTVATLKIEMVETRSKSNDIVQIFGLRPTEEDCLVGHFWNRQDGPHAATWNLSGIARDSVDAFNIDLSRDDLASLVALVQMLRNQ